MKRSPTIYFVYLPIALMLFFVFGLSIWLASTGKQLEIAKQVVNPAATPAKPPTVPYEEGTGRVKGKILLEDGSPNTSEVSVHYHSERRTKNSSSSRSGNGGKVTDTFDLEISSGDLELMFVSSDYAPAWLGPIENHADRVVEDLVVVLNPGVPLDISIINQDGNPINDANVYGYPYRNYSGGSHRKPKALEQGVYRFEHVNEVAYKVYVEADGYEPAELNLEHPESIGTYELELVRAEPTTGTVIDVENQPIANAKFLLYMREKIEKASSGSHSWMGKEIGQTDTQGKFELTELSKQFEYHGIIEAPDKRRALFTNLSAGHTGIVYELPPLRSIHITLQGDLSQIKERYFRGLKERYPYLKVDQRFKIETNRGGTHGEMMYEYLPLKKTESGTTVIYQGIFTNKIEIQIGPYRVDFNPNDYAETGDLSLEFNLDTGEKTIKAFNADATSNPQPE
ncbi:hypothetical protein [Rubinisphaera sp.]|uniref:hypothetical protein n=1 Tax=Rubinisphaera sp. TaxID=2024857 RepID=UPI0025D63A32|nr:hypothetical protein [Rubinisphaera sp.]